MKKLYLFLLTISLGSALGYLYFIELNSTGLFSKQNEFEYENSESKEAGKPDEYTKYFKAITTKFGEDEGNYPLNYRIHELNGAKQRAKNQNNRIKASNIIWMQRGPANVGGRTRGLIIDPDDPTHQTWYAGAATGGIWKTTDGGNTWNCLTDTLPNLSANTVAMAESNHNIIYAGTGESFPGGAYLQGSGIFKTIDRGATWTQLTSTISENFRFVNRLVVDPNDANIIVAATEKGIMKSVDGGVSWLKVYSSLNGIEDLDADPADFNNLYATENSVGVVISTDAGENWNLSNNGLEQGTRYELAVCKENSAKIYLSINSTTPMVYRSTDYGINWEKYESSGELYDFLGGQGDYNNIIAVHPYDEDVVFVAGVNMYKIDFSDPGTSEESDPQVFRVNQVNTASYIYIQPFSNADFAGILGLGTESVNNVTETDFSSIEIRFGPGMKQKAHRFTVGGQGPGVPDASYIYQDYVDVPFEVWDITNDKQLMISFRDQKENGIFDLEAADDIDDTKSREYLFINAIDYSETASTEIAEDGGHAHKQIYFLWPRLAQHATWDDSNLPDSKLGIRYGSITEVTGTAAIVADAYAIGPNGYNQSRGFGTASIPGLHPDHHNLIMIKTDTVNEKFTIINANDGGVAISTDGGAFFKQLPNNYITTQFYGVAKCPDANQYIGGMQDNGTWQSPNSVDATENSQYKFRIGGDGFECAWHREDNEKIIGSVYYNSFSKSEDGGLNWTQATNGIESGADGNLDGPFISRLSSHPSDPDLLFAVGYDGIYKSTDFGTGWRKIKIEKGWNSDSYIESKNVTSQHNIEPSLANENIVWAGAAMASNSGYNILVSTNRGESFDPVSEFSDTDLRGFISGIATHPFEDSTAYLLFSFANESKILRTINLGQSWEDISGFNGNKSSSNGFPDVVTHCLVVMPHDPSIIWVGTDVGLFESTDNGLTWHYLDSDLPAASVYDMFIQDGQVVIATHGRGIWTADIEELKDLPELYPITNEENVLMTKAEYNLAFDSVRFFVNNVYEQTFVNPSTGFNSIEYTADEKKDYKFHVIGYFNGEEYKSNIVRENLNTTGISKFASKIKELKAYPNPTGGEVTIELPNDFNGMYNLNVYALSGAQVYSTKISKSDSRINLNKLNNGLYIIRIENNGEIYSQKIQLRK